MTTIQIPESVENLTLKIEQETHVAASLETTFEALLVQLGSGNETPDGTPMPLKLEAWPGGRWYRDLGGDNGHFWAHVQAIKRPTLVEFVGPMFASFPFLSNVQYRLTEADGGTLVRFHHLALGYIQPDVRPNVNKGWSWILECARKRAESK
jgi:uncharacterized protein YndB with AHSA1/START domain